MKSPRVEITPPASPLAPPPVPGPAPGAHPGRPPLPAGWRALATGRRGTRLFHVTPQAGGGAYWEAEVTLHDVLVRRRFASELHGRAWLSLATELRPSAVPFDLEERNGPFRAAGVIAAGHHPSSGAAV